MLLIGRLLFIQILSTNRQVHVVRDDICGLVHRLPGRRLAERRLNGRRLAAHVDHVRLFGRFQVVKVHLDAAIRRTVNIGCHKRVIALAVETGRLERQAA